MIYKKDSALKVFAHTWVDISLTENMTLNISEVRTPDPWKNERLLKSHKLMHNIC